MTTQRPPLDQVVPESLLVQARAGDGAALGRLLELYRNYLRLVARASIGQALRVRLDASDLVQETFLKAHREFASSWARPSPSWSPGCGRSWSAPWPTRPGTTAGRGATITGEESLEVMLDRSSAGRPAGPGRTDRVAQRRRRPARAGRPAGRCPGETARRLSRGLHPA